MQIAGRPFLIPAQPAGPWLLAIREGYRAIVPGMVAGLDADDLLDLMVDGRVRQADLHAAARDAIAEMSGTKWWTAARLTSWLLGNWTTLGGSLLSRGVDPAAAPLGAVLAVTYRLVLETCKNEQERARIDMELDLSPSGVSVEEMYDEQQATASFLALAAANGGD